MANASAKKSAAAKAAAAQFYKPLLISVNVIYFALRYYLTQSLFWDTHDVIGTLESAFVLLVLLGLQLYSYYGILNHAAMHASKAQDPSLVGGSYLDLLAFALVVQYGALLISSKFYYALGVVGPLWGANSLLNTASMFSPPPSGSGPGAFASNPDTVPQSAYHQQLAARAMRQKKM